MNLDSARSDRSARWWPGSARRPRRGGGRRAPLARLARAVTVELLGADSQCTRRDAQGCRLRCAAGAFAAWQRRRGALGRLPLRHRQRLRSRSSRRSRHGAAAWRSTTSAVFRATCARSMSAPSTRAASLACATATSIISSPNGRTVSPMPTICGASRGRRDSSRSTSRAATRSTHYLVGLHRHRGGRPAQYRRACRDLLGSGEGIFGIRDAYADDTPGAPPARLDAIEARLSRLACAPARLRVAGHDDARRLPPVQHRLRRRLRLHAARRQPRLRGRRRGRCRRAGHQLSVFRVRPWPRLARRVPQLVVPLLARLPRRQRR